MDAACRPMTSEVGRASRQWDVPPGAGAGTGAKGSLSAAAALFSQSENIPEVARPRALKGVDPGRRWDSPSPLLGGACPAAARCAPPPPLLGLGFTRASLHPSPGRAALGLCLYLTKTSCCAAIGTCIGGI